MDDGVLILCEVVFEIGEHFVKVWEVTDRFFGFDVYCGGLRGVDFGPGGDLAGVEV